MTKRAEDRGDLPVLTVDVGNTSTSFGLFAAGSAATAEPLAVVELTTPHLLTADEARLHAEQVMAVLARDAGEPSPGLASPPLGSILSCVVPQLSDAWAQGLEAACRLRPLVVGPGLRTGLKMRYRDPAEIGPDRIADALAARSTHGSPSVAVDFGTTTNIEVIDGEGSFLGGIIAPGVGLGAQALRDAAARLPIVQLHAPRQAIGRSTTEAMRSGLVLGEAARVDGLLDLVFRELGESCATVLTGSFAKEVADLLAHEVLVDETLTLRGLHELYLLNS